VKTNLSAAKKNMALSDTQIEDGQVGNEPIIQKLVNFMDKLPIHKKMTIVVVSFVVIPLVLLMTVSGLYMQEQLRRDQERYLLASLAIARSEMQERENDILKCCYTLSQDKDLQNAVLAKDSASLAKKIKLVQVNFDKVDYAVVVDNKNSVLAKTDASVIYKASSPLGELVDQSLTQNKSLSSTEVFQLADLFEKNSELFKKFQIKLQDGFAGKGEYLNNAYRKRQLFLF
jgi:nitrogen fixation/metabolism regulation signal transduction histidine kinase